MVPLELAREEGKQGVVGDGKFISLLVGVGQLEPLLVGDRLVFPLLVGDGKLFLLLSVDGQLVPPHGQAGDCPGRLELDLSDFLRVSPMPDC